VRVKPTLTLVEFDAKLVLFWTSTIAAKVPERRSDGALGREWISAPTRLAGATGSRMAKIVERVESSGVL
jgi:hypothetical protein